MGLSIPTFGERRFRLYLAGFEPCYAVVTLPEDYQSGKKYSVLFEYTGNYFPQSGSSGEVEDASLGYGITGGKNFIWVVLPFVSEQGNERTWWGEREATIRFAIDAVTEICSRFGGDPDNLFLCGFSRGAIAVNYIGLANDEIASLWKGLLTFDHYDGVREWGGWGSPLCKYRREARERLKRTAAKQVLIVQQPDTREIQDYLGKIGKSLDFLKHFTFLDVPMEKLFQIPNDVFVHPHTDKWLLFDNEFSAFVRNWILRAVNAQ